jgi:hypothetical protein
MGGLPARVHPEFPESAAEMQVTLRNIAEQRFPESDPQIPQMNADLKTREENQAAE